MRQLTDHIVNGLNEALRITVLDDCGHSSGATHRYHIDWFQRDLSSTWVIPPVAPASQTISFQRGPIVENGVNGISQEALLAILIDRLRGFQSGQFACDDNAEALAHLQGALECLQRRTKGRVARGVEGTNQA